MIKTEKEYRSLKRKLTENVKEGIVTKDEQQTVKEKDEKKKDLTEKMLGFHLANQALV